MCYCSSFQKFYVQLWGFTSDWLHDSVEAADLFKAAEDNAKWRYRSYQRMLSTDWSKEYFSVEPMSAFNADAIDEERLGY